MAGGFLDVRILGLDGVRAELARMQADAGRAAAAGLYAVGSEMMRNAKRRTPVLTGALRGSGYVERPAVTGTRCELALGFGGPAKAYAWAQHERLDYRHAEGEAKFLENAIRDVQGSTGPAIWEAAADAALRRGQGAQPSGDVPTGPGGGSARGKGAASRRSGRRTLRGGRR